jgi:hypothetical protein
MYILGSTDVRQYKGGELVMIWRQIPQTSPRAVIAREKIKPLTGILVVQVRVGFRPIGSYSSRSRIVSHRTFSEARGSREDKGGESLKQATESKDSLVWTMIFKLGIATSLEPRG